MEGGGECNGIKVRTMYAAQGTVKSTRVGSESARNELRQLGRRDGRRVGWRDSAYSRVRGPVLPSKQESASFSRVDVSVATTQLGTATSSSHGNLHTAPPCYDLYLWDPIYRVIVAARICDAMRFRIWIYVQASASPFQARRHVCS